MRANYNSKKMKFEVTATTKKNYSGRCKGRQINYNWTFMS